MVAFNVSVSGTTTGSAIAYTSTTRWNYITVTNGGGATPGPISVRLDGTAAVAGADGTYQVDTGESLTFANGLPYWNQSRAVVKAGTLVGGLGQSIPGEVQPFGTALDGGVANPGTSISVIGTAGATYDISAAG